MLPFVNPTIDKGMQEAGLWAGAVKDLFKTEPPPNLTGVPQIKEWIPIIPLCGSALIEVPPPLRAKLSNDDLSTLANLVFSRIKGIKGPLLQNAPGVFRTIATSFLFNGKIKDAIQEKLRSALGDNVDPSHRQTPATPLWHERSFLWIASRPFARCWSRR